MGKQPLLALVGPTASGKTALAVELAKRYHGEVVSADSMQIYRGMSIATAKPAPQEMQGIPHHLMDFLSPGETFSVADYAVMARKCIGEIASRGALPVLAGGTGLYIQAVVDHIQYDQEEPADSSIRTRLEKEMETFGPEEMHRRLEIADPESAAQLHPNNRRRIIRALEVWEKTGIPISQQKLRSRREESPYQTVMLGLDFPNRQDLYDRINRRVDVMLESGLLEEAKTALESGMSKTARQAIGIKELLPYCREEAALEQCVETLKQETRRYAKRQLTWFRRDPRIQWISLTGRQDVEEILKICEKAIAISGLI